MSFLLRVFWERKKKKMVSACCLSIKAEHFRPGGQQTGWIRTNRGSWKERFRPFRIIIIKKTTKPRTTYCVTVVNTAVGILLFFFLNITTEYTNVSAVGLCVIIIEATKLDIDKTGGYLISETWMALLFSLLCISIRIIIEHWSLYFDYYLIWAWWEAYKLEDLTIFL